MPDVNYGERVINLNTFLKHSETIPRKKVGNRVSPYKLVLFFNDWFVATLAFGLAVWSAGMSGFMKEDLSQAGVVFVISLMAIAFFQTFNLYSYHLIFLAKRHLASLLKAFLWSSLSIGILLSLFTWPEFFVGKISFAVIAPLTLALMLGSRFFGDQVLNLIKSMGLTFLAIGIIALIVPGERPVIIEQWVGVPIGLSLAVGGLLVSRMVLVHVIFNKWMRRRFRYQIAIVGPNQEAQNIMNHIIGQNAPFWVTGIIGQEDTSNLAVSVSKDRLGGLEDLPNIAKKREIDEIIVTDENINERVLISLLDYCISEGITVWFSPKLMPIIDIKLYIS